jgi:F-type H+-transporting ATPase subunit epsilon
LIQETALPDSFQCTLVTPESQLLDEQVVYASIPAWDGLMGIAPQHAPLVAKLGDGALRVDFAQGGSRIFFVGGGFAQVRDNHLTLLTPEAVPAMDIVGKDAQAALRQAEAMHAITDQQVTHKQRQVTRAKTLLHLLETRGDAGGRK